MSKPAIIIHLRAYAETFNPRIARANHPEIKKILEKDKLEVLNLATELETGQLDLEQKKK